MFKKQLIITSLLTGMILSGCGASQPSTPTTDPNLIITQVAATIEANLALTASAQPTETFTPEPTATPALTDTPQVTATIAGLPTVPGGVAAAAGPDAMAFSADVTVPDNTVLDPKHTFVKTWQITNTGTTTWNSNYKLVYWDGVSNNEIELVVPTKEVNISGEVKPGAQTNISVKMVSPTSNGTYKIWWRLLNADGNAFGDQLYALIIVNDGTLTLVPSPTVTPTK